MSERIILDERETHSLERERLGGGETSQLLLMIGDSSAIDHHLELLMFWNAEHLVESGQASVPSTAARHVGSHAFSWNACPDSVLLTALAVELFRGNLEFASSGSFDRLRNP